MDKRAEFVYRLLTTDGAAYFTSLTGAINCCKRYEFVCYETVRRHLALRMFYFTKKVRVEKIRVNVCCK